MARHHRLRQRLDPVAPDAALSYAESFLTMLRGETPTEQEARAFDVAMILHAEHELNASTFTARVVAGTGADMHSAITAAICALKGPTHGGANEAAMRTFEGFGSVDAVLAGVRGTSRRSRRSSASATPSTSPTIRARASSSGCRSSCRTTAASRTGTRSRRRPSATVHEQKGLWPNVDLYSGSLYRYLGIPNDLFTPLFECSRVAGQAAHVLEQHANKKIIRPAAEYVGPERREFPVRSA